MIKWLQREIIDPTETLKSIKRELIWVNISLVWTSCWMALFAFQGKLFLAVFHLLVALFGVFVKELEFRLKTRCHEMLRN